MPPTNRFVGVFDVIGFKALRASRGTEGLYQLFERGLIPAIQHSAAGRGKIASVHGHKQFVPDFNEASVGLKVFSDTVIFYTKNDTCDSFLSIVNASFMLLQFGFNGGRYPFRGSIAYGDLIVDDERSIILGSALEEAYAAEQSQVWAGCMLTSGCAEYATTRNFIAQFRLVHDEVAKSTSDPMQKARILERSRRLVQYGVPLQIATKPGPTAYSERTACVIDWTIQMYEGAARASFDSSQNQHAQRIMDNTIKFEQWARANNR